MNVEGSVRGKLITTLIVDTHVLATVIFFKSTSKLLRNVILLDITNLEINNIKESGFLIFYILLEIILANDFQTILQEFLGF